MILLDPSARPIIGHRGASGHYPENTMLAFERALADGADGLELDVRTTADGVPVVIHDATVNRTTNGTGFVRGFTRQSLATLDAGRGERVPLLDDVLERFATTPLIVELKEPRAGRAIQDALRRHRAVDRVVVGSFHDIALRRFRPPFHRAATRAEIGIFWLAARLGVAIPWRRYDVFAVPEYHGRIHIVHHRFVQAAKARGIPVHVWTVNDVEDGKRLRHVGVTGILTDFPKEFRAALGS